MKDHEPVTETEAGPPLSRGGRALRSAAVGVVLVLLLVGTFWGDDDMFPVGPFRMYSIANELDGRVATVTFEGVTRSGSTVDLGAESFGLRPAEVEGQLPRLLEDPAALGRLILAYEQLHPDAAEIVELRLIEEASLLEDGRPIATERRVLTSWIQQ